jgi:hypothetical protein
LGDELATKRPQQEGAAEGAEPAASSLEWTDQGFDSALKRLDPRYVFVKGCDDSQLFA